MKKFVVILFFSILIDQFLMGNRLHNISLKNLNKIESKYGKRAKKEFCFGIKQSNL